MNGDAKRTLQAMMDDPESMDVICAHCANGGSLIELCRTWGLHFGAVTNWIRKDATRNTRYSSSLIDRGEYTVETVLKELRALGVSDIRELFNPDGSMKPVTDWGSDVARAVSSIEVNELFEGVGRDRQQIGFTKKVRFWDKTKALELLGKNLAMFIDRTQHDVKVTLEDLVKGSFATTQVKSIDAVADTLVNAPTPEAFEPIGPPLADGVERVDAVPNDTPRLALASGDESPL